MSDSITDDQLSQFLAFTGSADPEVARQYLEMSGNQLETAVSLFMDHNGSGGGGTSAAATSAGGAAAASMASPQVRAPDATRSMRLVGGPPSPGGNNNNDVDAAAFMAAVGGPNAAQQMQMMMGGIGVGGYNNDPMEDAMASTWASRDLRETVNRAASSRGNNRRNRSGSGSARGNNDSNSRRQRTGSRSNNSSARNNNNNNNEDEDDEVQVLDEDGNNVGQLMEESDEDSYHYNDQSDDDSMGAEEPSIQNNRQNPPSLSTMFEQPHHLIHRAGGFLGAKNFAKDARRWLLVNIQSEDDFACHALNRDVWHDETVENVVREGFVFWQMSSSASEGQTYVQRYKVGGYPHIAIIDPRTGSLLYRKEGWTQVNPLTAEQFVEIAMDFCSRHSFDKLPMPARHGYAANGGGESSSLPVKRPVHELSEQEQLEAAIRASMEDASGGQQSEDDDEVQILEDDHDNDDTVDKSINDEAPTKSVSEKNDEINKDIDDEPEVSKLTPFEKEILTMSVPAEPTTTGPGIAKVQLRMPNGKRLVRKFDDKLPVKVIYAFAAAQLETEEEKGKGFELKAKFPPVDLMKFVEDSIESAALSGEAITFLWK